MEYPLLGFFWFYRPLLGQSSIVSRDDLLDRRVPRLGRPKNSSSRRVPMLEVLEDRMAPAVFVVNSFLDAPAADLVTGVTAEGTISLRSAVMAANASSEADTILLPAGDFLLTIQGEDEDEAMTGDLDVTGDLTIVGQGASTTRINSNTLDRVFEVSEDSTLELQSLSILGGIAQGSGGGIFNSGNMIVADSVLRANQAFGTTAGFGSGEDGSPGLGGGIFNNGGTVQVVRSSIFDNVVFGGDGADESFYDGGDGGLGAGGGIFNEGGFVEIVRSLIFSNHAFGGQGGGNTFGGLGIESGPNPVFNPASGPFLGQGGDGGPGSGGGIYSRSGLVEISRSTIAENSAAGGLGGAPAGENFNGAGDGGDGLGGGLAAQNASIAIENSTVAGNLTLSGSPSFGGVFGIGRGGGIFETGSNVSLRQTILGENSADVGVDGSGTIISLGFNLIESPGDLVLLGNTTNDILNEAPLLGSVAYNGGPTFTQALLPGSPAIDAGDPTPSSPVGSEPSTAAGTPVPDEFDQRGAARIGIPDIGAFEVNPFVVTRTFPTGNGSLVAAIAANNDAGGGNTIQFLIEEVGSSHTIFLGNDEVSIALPVITQALVLDGWSQGGPDYSGPPLIEVNGSGLGRPAGEIPTGFLPAEPVGLEISSGDVVVRGLAINEFNDGSGGGVGIVVADGSRNVWLAGNYVGTDLTGSVAMPNGRAGIVVRPLAENVLIGTDADTTQDIEEANVISGNDGHGIILEGNNSTVAGNIIGSNPDQFASLGNFGNGIRVLGSNNRIGLSGAGNVIANNGPFVATNDVDGAIHVVSGTGNEIRFNEFFGNAFANIRLGVAGPNANDVGDPDLGPNNLQNFPQFESAFLDDGTLVLRLLVDSSTANSQYPLEVDLYLPDESGQGVGAYVGSLVYPEDSAQQTAQFNVLSGRLPSTEQLLATVTDANGNTSEFSELIDIELNTTPEIDFLNVGGPDVILEGDTIQLDGRFSGSDGEAHLVEIDWGDGSALTVLTLDPEVLNFGASHTYVDDFDPATIRVLVRDDFGAEDTETTALVIENVAPIWTIPDQESGEGTLEEFVIGENELLTLMGVVADPGEDTIALRVDFEDGSREIIPLGFDPTFTLMRQFEEEGTFPIRITAFDDDGASTTDEILIFVLPGSPETSAIGTPENGIVQAQTNNNVGDAVAITLTLNDPTKLDTRVIVALLESFDLKATDIPAGILTFTEPSFVQFFDVRVVNGTALDTAIVIFEAETNTGIPPDFVFVDPVTELVTVVEGSKGNTNSLIIEPIPGTTRFRVTVLLDTTSNPTVQELFGTVFAFVSPLDPSSLDVLFPLSNGPTLPRPGSGLPAFVPAFAFSALLANGGPNGASLSLSGIPNGPIATTDFVGGVQVQVAASSDQTISPPLLRNQGGSGGGGSSEPSEDEAQSGSEAQSDAVAQALQWSENIHRRIWGTDPGAPQPRLDSQASIESTNTGTATPQPADVEETEPLQDALNQFFGDLAHGSLGDQLGDLVSDPSALEDGGLLDQLFGSPEALELNDIPLPESEQSNWDQESLSTPESSAGATASVLLATGLFGRPKNENEEEEEERALDALFGSESK
ncbi:MAG: choice-of-anchor Q domain-containing protein [Gemmataceae bacterium]